MQQVHPFLWFDGRAEEAATFYVSLFDDAEITDVQRTPQGAPGSPGEVMTVGFRLADQRFTALNGGPQYSFTPAVSFFVRCDDQAEVDRLWDALTDGGQEQPCGWLVDRFGLSWQVVPARLMELLGDPDPERAQRAMQAMLKMRKIDVAALESAADGT